MKYTNVYAVEIFNPRIFDKAAEISYYFCPFSQQMPKVFSGLIRLFHIVILSRRNSMNIYRMLYNLPGGIKKDLFVNRKLNQETKKMTKGMNDEKEKWTAEDVRRWRLELIKRRHREMIISPGSSLRESFFEGGEEVPDFDETDELEELGMSAEYRLDIGH